MDDVRGEREVAAWLEDVHPSETRRDARSIFASYFAELPGPLARVVGECLTPEERSSHPLVRERRRRFAASAPEELSVRAQRAHDPARWRRTVGTGQDEEFEDLDLETELRHDAQVERRDEGHGRSAPPDGGSEVRAAQHTDGVEAPRPPSEAPERASGAHGPGAAAPPSDAPLATDGTLRNLHQKYLDAIDDDADEPADAALLAEFAQATLGRFVRGQLPVSYACDYDERWDVRGAQDHSNERLREDAWFDDE